jgi:hypothetical protein
MKLAEFDPADFRRNADGVLPEQDIEILVLAVALYQARPNRSPYSDVAHQLGITQGRVRHRTFRSVKVMPTVPILAPYAEAFAELIAKKFSMFTPGG